MILFQYSHTFERKKLREIMKFVSVQRKQNIEWRLLAQFKCFLDVILS